jgi:hypothetical protein
MESKKWIIGIFFIFQVFVAKIVVAQSDHEREVMSAEGFDSTYLADYTNLVTARMYLLYQNASLLINTADEKIPKIVYRPNVTVRVGLAGFWKWLGLGLSINNPFYKPDEEIYGKTTTLDLRANAFGRATAGEFFLQKYKGFYISSPLRQDGTHYIIPDMEILSIGIGGYWIYNAKRFSMRAAFIQTERQKKSAGSLLVKPSFLYFRISSGMGIIPEEVMNDYGIPPASLVHRGEVYSIGLSPGYAYTFVFLKNFYLTAAIFPGVAAQFSSYSNQLSHYSATEFNFTLSGRFACGYNSDKWFLGGSVQTGFKEVPDHLSKALFIYDPAQYRFWGGTRFDIFKKKKKRPAAY